LSGLLRAREYKKRTVKRPSELLDVDRPHCVCGEYHRQEQPHTPNNERCNETVYLGCSPSLQIFKIARAVEKE
jgi:hypothetical protein